MCRSYQWHFTKLTHRHLWVHSHFQVKLCQPFFSSILFQKTGKRKNLSRQHRFFTGQMPFLSPNHQHQGTKLKEVKPLNPTMENDPILSSSITRITNDGMMFHSSWLSERCHCQYPTKTLQQHWASDPCYDTAAYNGDVKSLLVNRFSICCYTRLGLCDISSSSVTNVEHRHDKWFTRQSQIAYFARVVHSHPPFPADNALSMGKKTHSRQYTMQPIVCMLQDQATDTDNMQKKFGKDRMCASSDILADRQTDRPTNRHTHHNTSQLLLWAK